MHRGFRKTRRRRCGVSRTLGSESQSRSDPFERLFPQLSFRACAAPRRHLAEEMLVGRMEKLSQGFAE